MPVGAMDNCAAAGVCCTPFSGCGFCFGINLPPQGFKLTMPPKNSNPVLASVNRTFISDFLSYCFHPPEKL
jgi:hypothetical protein